MDNNEAFNTIKEIRDLMNKSSRFQNISGLSIIIVGIYATVVSLGAWLILGHHEPYSWLPTWWGADGLNTPARTWSAIICATVLVAVSFLTVCAMSFAKAKRRNRYFTIDATVRRPLLHFFVPAIAGGLVCLALLLQGHYGLTSSMMLIFYGLSLINCHHYTTSSIGLLGYGQLLIGLVDLFVISHGLLFWFLGFGLLHILFGIWFMIKYK